MANIPIVLLILGRNELLAPQAAQTRKRWSGDGSGCLWGIGDLFLLRRELKAMEVRANVVRDGSELSRLASAEEMISSQRYR